MTVDEIIFQMRQGMNQFVMSTYYKLTGSVGNQEAANQTLQVIHDVRSEFINKAEYSLEDQVIELLQLKRNADADRYNSLEDEQEKFQLRKNIEKMDELVYNIRKVFEEMKNG